MGLSCSCQCRKRGGAGVGRLERSSARYAVPADRFLGRLLDSLTYLTLVNFAGVAVGFVLAWLRWPWAAAALLAPQALCAVLWQRRLVHQLGDFVLNTGSGRVQEVAIRRMETAGTCASCFACQLHFLSRLPDFAAPLLDASQAGQAVSYWITERFVAAWCDYPVVGEYTRVVVTSVGLQGILACILTFATCRRLVQAYGLTQQLRIEVEGLWADGALSEHWNRLALLCECGNALLVAAVLAELGTAAAEEEGDDEEKLPDTCIRLEENVGTRFDMRVLGQALPSQWFQVWMLCSDVFLYGWTLRSAITATAVANNFLVVARGLAEMGAAMRVEYRKRAGATCGATCRFKVQVVLSLFTAAVCVLSFVRLFGIWLCPSNVLDVGGCKELPQM